MKKVRSTNSKLPSSALPLGRADTADSGPWPHSGPWTQRDSIGSDREIRIYTHLIEKGFVLIILYLYIDIYIVIFIYRYTYIHITFNNLTIVLLSKNHSIACLVINRNGDLNIYIYLRNKTNWKQSISNKSLAATWLSITIWTTCTED